MNAQVKEGFTVINNDIKFRTVDGVGTTYYLYSDSNGNHIYQITLLATDGVVQHKHSTLPRNRNAKLVNDCHIISNHFVSVTKASLDAKGSKGKVSKVSR